MSKEKIDFMKKNEINCNFCSNAYFVYYKLLMLLVIAM